ncbi:hypothetical protein VA249_45360 (plasmid) [Vibrio alfacsensis]|uniref:hypothetical protein n=1 Tax=Vibrio alfacsensis TaxID=1074311 RepID=UPI001BF0BBE4|nr:hypothetical protein [Vibrio alfacsensis]BBM67890.1 hypothetical protein VA249_45360 [Vibrio alfacsensis]
MSIKVPFEQRIPQIEIDLRGPQGNVFYLFRVGQKLAHQLGMDWDLIFKRMANGDYVQAVRIFDAYFGQYVTMYVSEELREELA